MKCSFCEESLVCKSCRQPYQPRSSEGHLGTFQADSEVSCPVCQKVLVCAACNFVYGEDADTEGEEP